jgi:hypothetical protein
VSDNDQDEVVIADFVAIDICPNCGSPAINLFDVSGKLVAFVCLPEGSAPEAAEQLMAAHNGTLVDFEPEEEAPRLTAETPCAGKA